MVEQPDLLTRGAGHCGELLMQTGGPQRSLTQRHVQLQCARLRAGVGGGVVLEDGDRYVVALQNAGAGQSAGAGADDRDTGSGGGHGAPQAGRTAGPPPQKSTSPQKLHR